MSSRKLWYDTMGDGYDCETCGWSNETIEVTEEDGTFTVSWYTGCYGGGDLENLNREEAAEYILKCEPIHGRRLAENVLAGTGYDIDDDE